MAARKAKRIDADQWRFIEDAQLAAILHKVKAGKVLTAREAAILERAREVPKGPKVGKDLPADSQPLEIPDDDPATWLPPSAFLRWLKTQGVSLSRKGLYKTYFGKGARHPVHTSPDGKRIHKFKAIELIRMIQGGDGLGDSSRIIAERQAADARFRTAKARAAELELEELEGKRVAIEVIDRVWATMWENVKNEARTASHNLPRQLVGQTAPEIRAILEKSFHQIFAHLAQSCRDRIPAAKTRSP